MADPGTPLDEPIVVAEAAPLLRDGWRMAFRSLRHRDFRLFWMGLIVSVTGTWMQMAAQLWLVDYLTESPLYVGVVAASGTLPMLLFTLPGGVIADRFRKRNVVMVTQSLAMLQAFTMAALIYTGVIQVWHVAVLAAVLGTVNSVDMPTRQAMVLELVDRDCALNAVALNSSAFNLGRFVGPGASGFIIAAIGPGGCYLANGLSFLAILVALATIPARPAGARLSGRAVDHVADGVKWVRANRVAVAILALTAVSGIFAMPYTTLMPVYARVALHAGPQRYGFLFSAAGLGALTSAALLARFGHRWRVGRLVTIGSLIFPFAMMAVAGAPHYSVALLTLYLNGVGLMLFNAVSNTMLQTMPPDSLRGRVMSLRAFVFAGMAPLGNLQIGVVAQCFGPRTALTVGGVICLLSALVVAWRVPALRRAEE
jgi:MFS family permease